MPPGTHGGGHKRGASRQNSSAGPYGHAWPAITTRPAVPKMPEASLTTTDPILGPRHHWPSSRSVSPVRGTNGLARDERARQTMQCLPARQTRLAGPRAGTGHRHPGAGEPTRLEAHLAVNLHGRSSGRCGAGDVVVAGAIQIADPDILDQPVPRQSAACARQRTSPQQPC